MAADNRSGGNNFLTMLLTIVVWLYMYAKRIPFI
jgi:hypothetical protein